ncbi:MAG: hypothetical protein FWG16_04040 [Micrococcales bacterium]|nr:hypothetical protein [Micrococcales bacterium]
MSAAEINDFQSKYRALVEAACEWRALQADPSKLANQVFDRLRRRPERSDLFQLFKVIEQVVLDTYRDEVALRPNLSLLTGQGGGALAKAPNDTDEMAKLRGLIPQLNQTQRDWLQLAYWDELGLSELAEVRQTDVDTATSKLEQAHVKFAALIKRHINPKVAVASVPGLFRSLKPGQLSRWESTLW